MFILADRSKGIRFHHGGGKAWLMAGAELISSNTSRKQRDELEIVGRFKLSKSASSDILLQQWCTF